MESTRRSSERARSIGPGEDGLEGSTENHDARDGRDDSAVPVPAPEPGMAADISALRSILFAAAKHFNVQVNPDLQAPSQGDVDFSSIKPGDDSYDEEATIKRQIALLPSKSMLASEAFWTRYFKIFPPSVEVDIRPRNWSESTEGLQVLIQWGLPLTTPVETIGFGYDSNGYPCELCAASNQARLRRRIFSGPSALEIVREHVYIGSKANRGSPSWAGQHFGKEWVFHLGQDTTDPDPSSLALAISQLLADAHYPRDMFATAIGEVSPLQSFRRRFSLPWRPSTAEWTRQDPLQNESRTLVFHYHMRVLNASASAPGSKARPLPLPYLNRKQGWSRVLGTRKHLVVTESRLSVAVRTTCDLDLPLFSLVVLSDLQPNGSSIIVRGPYHLGSAAWWEKAGIRPAIRSTAISAFAFRIHSLCTDWAMEWNATLNMFDKALTVRLEHVLSPTKRPRLMYDDSDLALSELYFFISQLLRFSALWIRESVVDLRDLVGLLEVTHFSLREKECNPHASFLPDSPEAQRAAVEVFKQNWAAVMSHQQKLADGLLERIAKKQEEVSSLREALFTATAVSETAKSKQLNHYILVFTVVTIFYLPLSFVAALYALDLFSWDDPNQKVSFVVTLVVVAGATYCFAGGLIWFVRKPERRRMLKKAKHVKSIGQLFERGKPTFESDSEEDLSYSDEESDYDPFR